MSAATELSASNAPGSRREPRRAPRGLGAEADARVPRIAVAAIAGLVALGAGLGLLVGSGPAFLVLAIAVLLGAWYGGRAAGVIVLVLTAAVGLVSGRGTIGPGPGADALAIVYLAVGAMLIGLADRARASQHRHAAHEDALASAQRRYRRVLESSEEGAWIADAHGALLYASPALARMIGCSPEEAATELEPELARLAGGRRSGARFEAMLRRCDGGETPVRITLADVRGDDGRAEGTLGLVTDLTPLRRMEQERDRLQHDERRARAEADDACRARDEFLAIVSHELRTPLNAVLGWASLLSRDLPPETRAKAVSAIQRSARAQAQLIEDLLDTSRMRAGRLTLDLRLTPVAPAVRAALAAIAPDAAARGIEIQSSIPDDLHDTAVLGDGHRIQQIVANLLSNALKFTPRGRAVHVALGARADAIDIVVRDEGDGIDPEVLPTLFEPFRPGDRGPTKRHGGLGLGLAIVRHLVAEHGGTIEARSPGEGQGATFTVSLPRAAAASSAVPRGHRDEEPRSAPAPRALQGVAVLLVDDDADGREALAAVLTRAGATVHAAGSVEQAWREIRDEGWVPDVLVSDLAMPHDDGVDLVTRVRSLPRSAGGGVPALAVSAHARSADRSRASAAGFDRHLAKPVDPEELVRAVAELARASASDRDAATAHP